MNREHRRRRVLRLHDVERDLDEELAFHLEMVTKELEGMGMKRENAEEEARRRFGNEDRYRRDLTEIDRGLEQQIRMRDRVSSVLDVMKHAWRSMAHTPILSLGIVVAFALGIGVNTTVFTMVDRLLLRPPPQLTNPSSLRLYTAFYREPAQGRERRNGIHSYADFQDLVSLNSLAGAAGYNAGTRDLTIGRGEGTHRAKALPVSGEYFPLLGVRPLLGRLITSSDDQVGAERVIVLSHAYWRRQYGGARDTLGRTIDFGQGPHTIVGVLPAGFTGIDMTPVDVWLPVVPYRAVIERPGWKETRFNQWMRIVVRLAPGATDEAVTAELTTRFRRTYLEEAERGRFSPQRYPADAVIELASLIPGQSPLAPREVALARWLVAMSVIVLVIASLNISNLLLARAIRDRRALGLRLALGVTRKRILGQVLIEVVGYALVGGTAALLIARYGGATAQRLFLPNYAWEVIGFPTRLLWVTAALAVVAGISAALVPAAQMAGSDVLTTLRASGGSIAGGRSRLRTSLVVAQIALSVLLLGGAGVFVRSFGNALRLDLGVEPERAWVLTLDTDGDIDDPNQVYDALSAAFARVPGVSAAGGSSTRPFFDRQGGPLRVEGWDSLPERVYRHSVVGDYFAALGLSILEGRAIGAGDVAGAEPVAIVNDELARTLFPSGALGRCLYVEDPDRCTRVVGVVESARIEGVRLPAPLQFYVSPLQHADVSEPEAIVIRLAEDVQPTQVLNAVRTVASQVQPSIRYVDAQAADAQLETELRSLRLAAAFFTAFGFLALFIAALGLYAMISFDVSQRLRDIGLRAALGASPVRLHLAVLGRMALVVSAGLALGITIGWAVAPRLADLVYDVAPRDPLSLGAVVLVVLGITALAAILPALRAARVDPVLLLRSE